MPHTYIKSGNLMNSIFLIAFYLTKNEQITIGISISLGDAAFRCTIISLSLLWLQIYINTVIYSNLIC